VQLNTHPWRRMLAAGGICALVCGGLVFFGAGPREAKASPHWFGCRNGHGVGCAPPACETSPVPDDLGGTWYWLRSPDEEKRVVAGLYNRYCIRCHGVDGRGVWDIPDVPDFTNAGWQSSRSDGQIARITLEGRGAVMPPFRGTLTLEEAWAMARYLRTFVPGTETPRPDKPAAMPELPGPKKVDQLSE
jgi:mono/diheme cytochrome c family protein